MKNFFLLLFAFVYNTAALTFADTTCVNFSGLGETIYQRPVLANAIPTEHFKIHWEFPTTLAYAQNTAAYAEYAYQKICIEMGWQVPPTDDNRGGDNRYDIYLVNPSNIQGFNGVTQPEIPENWPHEWSPSFVLIRNNIETDEELKMIIAHEFNHATQLAYTCRDGATDTWFFENTAVWVAEIVYNYAYNYYLHYFQGPDPLQSPEFGIHTTTPDLHLYNYAGFLWPKFLAEWKNDASIVKNIWQRFGQNSGDNVLPDMNHVLSQPPYLSSLNEAARYYAEWRYFTGTRDDGMHFFRGYDLPTSSIFRGIPEPSRIDGFGGTKFIQYNPNEEIIEITFDGVDNVVWSANIIEHKYEPPSLNKSMALNSFYQGSIEVITEDCQYVVLTPILLSDITKKEFIHNSTQVDARKVYFYNKKVLAVVDGDLKLDNTIPIPSGGSKWMRYNSVLHNIKTLNERYQGSPLYKHINWNSAANKFLLNKDFMVQENNNEHSAIFIPLVAATVRNVIDEISFADSVPINFNDPWYVKDQYDNQSGMGDFLSFPSPYNPTGKYNQSVGGVFLNQNPTFDPTLPNYSVKAISPQDIPLQHSGKTHRFYFQNWEYDPNKIDLEHPEELETGVVFKDQNVVLKANMKGTQLSNEINAYTNNNQRKFVRGFSQLGGGYFNTYRSMDKVWLEFNDNTGWILLNNGKPLSDNESKNPSIDYWEKDALETFAFVVYQEKNNGDGYSIKIKVFNQDNMNVLYDGEVVNESTESFQTDANPVIAVGKGFDNIYINTLMVCWYKKEDSGDRPAGLYIRYGYFNSNTNTIIWKGPGGNTEPKRIARSGSSSINPSLSAPKQILNPYVQEIPFHIAYEEENQIGYNKLKLRGNWDISQLDEPVMISLGTGYSENYRPSIIAVGDTSSRICWIGERIEEPGHIEKTVVFTSSDNLGRYWTFGSNVNSTSINKMNDRYTISWAKTDDDYLEYTDSRTLRDIGRINIKGKDVQLSNGTELTTMRALAFNTKALPYYMQTAQVYTYQAPIKTDEKREGIVCEEDAQVYFSVGDATVDNEQISFVEIPDTAGITSQQTANQYLVSEPFTLTDNSEFFYSVKYGLTDSLAALSMLSGNKSLTFKVELLDAVTNEILGVFDEVTYDQGNIIPYEKVDYQVLTNGIGTRTVKLRLVINSNFNPEYSVAEKYDTETSLAKKSYKQISYKGSLAITEYALDQNYPNPFNPTTTINYQIKEDGLVTLKIYDILGSEVKTLVNEEKTQGRYSHNFNASDLASGVYIYQLRVNDFVSSKKLMLLK